MSKGAAIVGLIALTTPAAASAGKPLSVPLVWKTTTSVSARGPLNLTGLASVKVRFEPLVDARADKELIGENREDNKPKPVTATGDVPTFVTRQMVQLLDGVGISMVAEGGDAVISASLKRFFVTETNLYRGEVTLAARVTDMSGKVRWEGLVSGGAEHFGRSYKADNYQETFCDAVVDATYKLLAAPEFVAALRPSTP